MTLYALCLVLFSVAWVVATMSALGAFLYREKDRAFARRCFIAFLVSATLIPIALFVAYHAFEPEPIYMPPAPPTEERYI
jgi:hypothetical protein